MRHIVLKENPTPYLNATNESTMQTATKLGPSKWVAAPRFHTTQFSLHSVPKAVRTKCLAHTVKLHVQNTSGSECSEIHHELFVPWVNRCRSTVASCTPIKFPLLVMLDDNAGISPRRSMRQFPHTMAMNQRAIPLVILSFCLDPLQTY